MRKSREPDTIQSLQRKMERLEREFEMGVHAGMNEKEVLKRMKQINAKIRDLRQNENNSNSE